MIFFWNFAAIFIGFALAFPGLGATNLVSDYVQSVPELKIPTAGSLQGSLAKFNPGAVDLAQGSLSVPLSIGVDESRGPLQFNPFPSYSIHNGISEWGQGFEVTLDIHRYREGADLNFVDDDFTSPWGHLIRGADGAFYPKGLKTAVKVVIGSDQAQARLPDGSVWTFRRIVPSSVAGVPYGFALTEILSLTGDQTLLTWDDGARPLLKEINYGGKNGHTLPYFVRFNYENLPQDSVSYSYRSKKLAQLTKRIQSLQFFDSGFSGTMARWSYSFAHEFSGYSPAFYLSSHQKTYASGAVEPATRFTYDHFDKFVPGIISKKLDRLNAVLGNLGAGVIRSSGLSFYDYDNDGLVDVEVASSHKLYRQTEEGFQEIADFQPKADWQPCLPPESPSTQARRVIRLTGPYGRPLVFMNLPGSTLGTVRLLTCELDGRVVADQALPYDFAANALVTMGDLNGDQKPDLIRYATSSLEFLENVSTEDQIKFQYRGSVPLDSPTLEQSIAVGDINGDGIPDVFMNEGSFARVLFGKGNFEFLKKPLTMPYVSAGGQPYLVGDSASVSFLDANSDGLMDLAISRGREFYLLMNQGFRFKSTPIPFTGGRENEGEALPININGNGNPMVFRSSGSQDIFGMELSRAGLGLLRNVDDGQGNIVNLSFAYQAPGQAKVLLQKQLIAIEKTSLGKGSVKSTFTYGKSVFNDRIPRLLGYEQLKKVEPLLETSVFFQNPDESPGLIIQTQARDLTGSNAQKNVVASYAISKVKGIATWLKTKERRYTSVSSVEDPGYTETITYADDSLCQDSIVGSLAADRLLTHFEYSSIEGMETGLSCPVATVKREGKHSRREFDFAEKIEIDRDAWALPLLVKQVNGKDSRSIQTLSYDELHRLASVLEQKGLKHTYRYLDDSLLLDEHETSIGIKTIAKERYRNSLLKTHQTLHGKGNGYIQNQEYDNLERLSERRDNLYPTPLETLSYNFGSSTSLGFIRSIKNIDDSARSEISEYFTADGSSLAQIASLDSGRYLSHLNTFAPDKGYATAHAMISVDDDFAVSWSHYQAQVKKKSEVYTDGFALPRLSYLTHQESQIETTTGRLLLPIEGPTRQSISNGKFENLVRHDSLDRVIGRRDELKNWTNYAYDMAGRLREVLLANGTKPGAQYDNWGQLIRVSHGTLGSVEYSYNTKGLLEQKNFNDANGSPYRSLKMTYDPHGRLVKSVSSNTNQEWSIGYYYDGYTSTPEVYPDQIGFLTAVKGQHFEKRMQYDQKGRMILQVETLNRDGVRKTTQKTYYSNDKLKNSESAIEGTGRSQKMVWENILKSDGLPSEIKLNGRTLATLVYDHVGLLQSAAIDSGRWTVRFTYDPVTSNIQAYEAETNTRKANYSLQKDARGQIQSEQINSKLQKYAYDDRSFLISADAETFQYDAVGLMSIELPPASGVIFDTQGRLVQRGGKTFIYNGQGQVSVARLDDGSIVSYGYDEGDLRNLKTKDGSFQNATLSGTFVSADHVIEPLEIGSIVVGYVDNGNFQPLLGDLRGSVIDDGEQTKPVSVYGKRTTQEIWQEAVDFAGQPRDIDTGLVRMGVRDYDANLGRFVQPDPLFFENLDSCISSPVECSLYSYARNNPLSYRDPSGKNYVGVGVIVALLTFYDLFEARKAEIAAKTPEVGENQCFANPVEPGIREGDSVSENVALGALSVGVKMAKVLPEFHAGMMRHPERGSIGSTAGEAGQAGNPSGSKLKPNTTATGDHTVFSRDVNGNIYKYETYTQQQGGKFWNPVKRFDGGQPNGAQGETHFSKDTQNPVPTPHVQGKSVEGGVRPPSPEELPNNSRFNK